MDSHIQVIIQIGDLFILKRSNQKKSRQKQEILHGS